MGWQKLLNYKTVSDIRIGGWARATPHSNTNKNEIVYVQFGKI